jgi:peptide/nickel transport system permease protein
VQRQRARQRDALSLPAGELVRVALDCAGRESDLGEQLIHDLPLVRFGEDYVRMARAKGALERRVLARHVAPNALVPVVTRLGLYVPYLFGGSLVTEAMFNYPGMGLLFWNAAQTRDYPILLAVALIVAIATVAASLVVDLIYAVLDPRVRYVPA